MSSHLFTVRTHCTITTKYDDNRVRGETQYYLYATLCVCSEKVTFKPFLLRRRLAKRTCIHVRASFRSVGGGGVL